MSAARLAGVVADALKAHHGTPGPLLEILHAVQNELGCIPAEAVPLIAAGLNLSRAEVQGVVSFYHHFRAAPAGNIIVKLCRAEACQAMNAAALERQVKHRLGIGFGETTRDGRVTLEPVYCLGNCACAPALMVGSELHGRVTPARLDELATQWGVP